MKLKKNRILVLDTETTGLDPKKDELLQISIIDGNGKALLNTYCKPEHVTSWEKAMAVNGITPEKVGGMLPASYWAEYINKLVKKSRLIVHYNGKFDINFLREIGVKISDDKPQFDVMKSFAPIYGDRFKNGNFKNKKLVEAAEYFNYRFDAHDSLEDCKATLYCYYKIINPIRKFFRKPLKLVGVKI